MKVPWKDLWFNKFFQRFLGSLGFIWFSYSISLIILELWSKKFCLAFLLYQLNTVVSMPQPPWFIDNLILKMLVSFHIFYQTVKTSLLKMSIICHHKIILGYEVLVLGKAIYIRLVDKIYPNDNTTKGKDIDHKRLWDSRRVLKHQFTRHFHWFLGDLDFKVLIKRWWITASCFKQHFYYSMKTFCLYLILYLLLNMAL